MTKRQYMPLNTKIHLKTQTKSLALSTGILAGLVAAGGFSPAVNAQELDMDLEKLESLYEQYNQIEKSETDQDDGQKDDLSAEPVTELTVDQKEELDIIKKQLIRMIELAGGESVLEQLHSHTLSYEQLDTIFLALLERSVDSASDTSASENLEPEEGMEAGQLDTALEKDDLQDVKVKDETSAQAETETEEVVEEETAVEIDDRSESEENDGESSASEDIPADTKAEPDSDAEMKKVNTNKEAVSTFSVKTEEGTQKAEVHKVSSSAVVSEAGEALVYVVKSGDTLGKIAQQYGTTVAKLASLNKITDVNRLSVGQVLAVNEAGKEEAQAPQPTKPNDLNKAATPAEFVENISGYAQRVASEQNLYASVMIAQASLESGYGKSSLSAPPNHNLFGIKGTYNGQSVAKRTQEYYSSTGWITIIDNFKKYPSYEESLQDNADLLRRGLRSNAAFYSGTWAENTTSYRDATLWLQGRYATDPTYASKLNRIIEQFDLTRFDIVDLTKDSSENKAPDTPGNPYNQDKVTTYKIVSGDTLSKIAQKFHTTVRDLKAANKLNGDLIFVNQELVVPVVASEDQPETTPEKPEKPADNTDSIEDVTEKPDTAEETPSDAPAEEEKETTDNALTTDPYTVVSGDTLSQIAKRFSTTVSQLKELNKLTGDIIYVGQKLTVSVTVKTPAESEKPVEDKGQNTEKGDEEKTDSTVLVMRGDTLSQIAKRYGTTVTAIQKANKLISDRIYVGQRLILPDRPASEEKTEPEQPVTEKEEKPDTKEVVTPSGDKDETSYVVKSGDTLGHIARRFGTTVAELKEQNGLTSDLIRVSQKLMVSGFGAETTKTEPSKPAEKPVKENNEKTEKKEETTSASRYTVKSGDTLSQIARRFETTVSQLKSANKLTSDIIYVGQKLVVKESAQVKDEKAETGNSDKKTDKAEAKTDKKAAGETVKVKSGDSLGKIARQHGVSVAKLMQWNSIKNADRIYVGQTLIVSEAEDNSKKAEKDVAVVKPATPSKSENTVRSSYQIKAGDTLSRIAREYKVTVSQLKKWNTLTSDIIFVGQKLTVNVPSAETEKTGSVKTGSEVKAYTVEAGDTLSHIAKRVGLSLSELKEKNDLRSDLIFVNQRLTV